ncbi:hypothetical protein ALC60_05170 [Trachymyrmex zeteki]|uniref:Uncharacterized protein n=1 Tax=Mycetomoellerius zeteki TaxID=64791 RepID=A0A151X6H8_9HYME|nr:hypothetical protein ALC60_05170 [Trachymyrmex zeteki]
MECGPAVLSRFIDGSHVVVADTQAVRGRKQDIIVDETKGRKRQILARPSGPTGGLRRAAGPRSTKGEKSFEGMTEISEDDCTLRDACTCLCASEWCLMRADRPAGEMQAGPNSAGLSPQQGWARYNQTEADARVLSYARMSWLLGQAVNSYLE